MKTNLKIVRVVDIILDEEHPEWERCGRHDSIGTILYSEVQESTPIEGDLSQLPFARPAFYSITQYPLRNEIVYLTLGPDFNFHEEGSSKDYYLPPLGVQNHPLHNVLPKELKSNVTTLSNEEVEAGATNSDEFSLSFGRYFKELENIRPLRPYEGDIMIEGRFGNSIRLGATTFNELSNNNRWSNEGEVGNPITIIRNGQIGDQEGASYEHIIEDIDGDDSSIYLCSQQQLTDFIPASIYQLSFGANITTENTTEPVRDTQPMGEDIAEDPVLSSPLQEETIEDTEEIIEEETVAEWDIAGIEESFPLFPGDPVELPESYIVPEGENMNDELG